MIPGYSIICCGRSCWHACPGLGEFPGVFKSHRYISYLSIVNRRKALKNLAIASGGLITLPFWMGCGNDDKPATHLSSFSSKEQGLIAAVADTIIPTATGSAGALSMEVDKFLQKLIDDCYKKDVQDNIKIQLGELEVLAKNSQKKSFAHCSQGQREQILLSFSLSNDKQKKDFFNLMKSETIRGFTTSKEVMEKYLNYKIAPGHYYGCINVNS